MLYTLLEGIHISYVTRSYWQLSTGKSTMKVIYTGVFNKVRPVIDFPVDNHQQLLITASNFCVIAITSMDSFQTIKLILYFYSNVPMQFICKAMKSICP